MKRRDFITLLRPLPLGFLIGCEKQDSEKDIATINKIQDSIFDFYNDGSIQNILPYFHKNVYFIDGGYSGDLTKMEKRFRILYKYHTKKNILPIRIENRKTYISGNVGWIVCDLKSPSRKNRYGLLTQIFVLNNSSWKITHQHFSQSRI